MDNVFLSAGAAISWRSSMTKLVTHSSCESEYVGLSEAGNEAVYLNQLQGEMKIGKMKLSTSVQIICEICAATCLYVKLAS